MLVNKGMYNLFRLPYHDRYSELTEYIDRSAVKELEILYPRLIEEIFNTNPQINWGLRTLKPDTNYNTFYSVYNFLHPNGPIFRLCYKLLLDCHLRYEFPYQYLPNIVRKRLEDSTDTSFYKQKLFARSRTQSGNCIYLNAFEYYLFHFAYHLINPNLQILDENSLEWDTVYLRLVEAYLDQFVPCTTSLVYPLLNQTASAVTTSQPTVSSVSPSSKPSVSIFREDVLKKMSPSPPSFAKTKTNSSTETWRTELVATLFIDFWLSYYGHDSTRTALSYSAQKLWSVALLPSREQLRCIRLLLRHLHYFTNHLLPEDCAMNDLKREIVSNNKKTIYVFFFSVMTQLPLDTSYKLLLEAWFTYIQPWRYTNPYFKNSKVKGNKEGIERRWFSFIAENLIVYTRLYYIVLSRLSRCDLTTYKISCMSYRLMQVFSQPLLLEYIIEVENYLEEGRLGSISSWNSIVRQNIYCMEKLDYRYEFFYSTNNTQQAVEFIRQIEDSIPSLRIRKRQIQPEENVGFLKWLKEQLSGSTRYSSLEELQQIEFYLTRSLQKLYFIHKIPTPDPDADVSFLHSRSNGNESVGSFSSFESSDGISNYSGSFLNVDPKERRKAALSLEYEGDPDLYPVRSWENKFLVRVLYYVSLWINTQFQRDLKRLYYEDSIAGGVARLLLYPPLKTHYFEKRSSPDGYSRRVSTILPPRVSLRRYASYYFIFVGFTIYFITKYFQFNFTKLIFVILFFLAFYLMLSSVFFPVPVPEDEDDAISR